MVPRNENWRPARGLMQQDTRPEPSVNGGKARGETMNWNSSSRLLTSKAASLAALLGAAQQPFDLDPSFQPSFVTTGVGLSVNSVLPLADGDLIISGGVKFPGDFSPRAGTRLNPDGTRDLSYVDYPLTGGKLTAWNGRFYAKNGYGVRRLWLDGTLDPDFNMIGVPYVGSGEAYDYHIYPDGSMLAVGFYLLQDSIHGFMGDHHLIWFTNQGQLDTTAHHRKCNGTIFKIEPQPDGKFVCSGWQTTYEGQPVNQIFRVMPDGALDTTFQTDFVWGEASAFTVLPDGRIIASGSLLSSGASDTLQLIRMLPDGSLDPTFNNDLEAPTEQFGDFGYLGHTVLADGRIVLHRDFYQVEGQPRSGIAIVDADGNLLSDAFTGAGCGVYNDGFWNWHHTTGMAPAPDGSWYIYGSYHGYDDGTTNYPNQRFVSRLYGLDVGVGEQWAIGSWQLRPTRPAGA